MAEVALPPYSGDGLESQWQRPNFEIDAALCGMSGHHPIYGRTKWFEGRGHKVICL